MATDTQIDTQSDTQSQADRELKAKHRACGPSATTPPWPAT